VLLKFTPGLPNVLVFAITLTVPWAVGLVAARTPAARWLTGGERVRLKQLTDARDYRARSDLR
jgi:hypothetical protein